MPDSGCGEADAIEGSLRRSNSYLVHWMSTVQLVSKRCKCVLEEVKLEVSSTAKPNPQDKTSGVSQKREKRAWSWWTGCMCGWIHGLMD